MTAPDAQIQPLKKRHISRCLSSSQTLNDFSKKLSSLALFRCTAPLADPARGLLHLFAVLACLALGSSLRADPLSCDMIRRRNNKSIFPKQWYTDVAEAPSPRSLANFCAQAADLVRVRSLPCTRNGRSRRFRQKNTCFGTISFRSSSGPPLAQFPPSPGCVQDSPAPGARPKKYFDFFVT